jgi:NTP pyrophosphatase (non-canonical NTP hydrolase)
MRKSIQIKDREDAMRVFRFIHDNQEAIYQANKAKGFWDGQRNPSEALALVVCELAEAIEQHRKGNFTDSVAFIAETNYMDQQSDEDFKTMYEQQAKNTVEEELADALIRIADLYGFDWFDFPHFIDEEAGYIFKPNRINVFADEMTCFRTQNITANADSTDNFAAIIAEAMQYVLSINISLYINNRAKMEYAVNAVAMICIAAENIGCLYEMVHHIKAKLRYNSLRAKLHGKKY